MEHSEVTADQVHAERANTREHSNADPRHATPTPTRPNADPPTRAPYHPPNKWRNDRSKWLVKS